jgi:stage IV sporulation protein FB
VFLFEPNQTPYDLTWRMFGIHVRVHPLFWLVGAIMGWSSLDYGFEYLLIWIACMFVSILIHELGHIWMGLVYGSHGHIVLYGFGGLAIGSNDLRNPWQRIAVCFAGPLAGFLLVGAMFLCMRLIDPMRFQVFLEVAKLQLGLNNIPGLEIPRDLRLHVEQVLFGVDRRPLPGDFALQSLLFINLLWGLVNLLPIWPLDGGQISRDLCKLANPARGIRISLGISLAVAGILAIHSIMRASGTPLIPFLPIGSRWSALFFGLFAVQSFLLLQQTQRHDPDEYGWERDPEVWRR